jgi:signal transduction histidine kinase
MIKAFRTHLAWKVFLTYVIVILVGVAALALATHFTIPAAYTTHMGRMGDMIPGGPGGNMMGGPLTGGDLFINYQAAVSEAVTLAAAAALAAAIIASLVISRRVVGPVQKMMSISQRVAEGEYQERLSIAGNVQTGQLDELDQLALSFNQMAGRLEKTEAMRRQLIGDVAHELRTPLTAIKGYMEGLIDGVLPPTPETYQQVYTEADRLQRLVNDLQELSRVEAGAIKLNLDPLPMDGLVASVVSHLGRQFEEKGIHLETALPPGLPLVLADRDRILQVLTNLVGNALQYTQPGGLVTILAAHDKNEVVVTVKDTGIGIAASQLPHIFDRFYRADKSRARASGGSGIGLTIAQALVKANHGRIWAESPGEGQGSAFHFSLPVKETEASGPDHHS